MPRTVTVLFPDAPTEYWLTEAAVAVGDKLRRNGEAWIVAAITEAENNGGQTIKLRSDDGSQAERRD